MIKIDNIPIQDYATPYSRSCYVENYNQFFGKTIIGKEITMSEEEKEAIEYWKNYMNILHWNTQLASEHYMKILLNLIDKLQEENEELKKDNKMLNEMVCSGKQIPFLYTTPKFTTNENFISKDKIRNKIEELEDIEQEEIDYSRIKFAIIVLEELLGDDINEN